jgi:pyrroloquinoline quinone (PQQ) biosynthesis protein C
MVAGTVQVTDVRAWIDELDALAARCMERDVIQHPFFEELGRATLPREKVQEFFRQWYAFALEINTAMGTLYHRFHWLTKRLPELEDFLTQKIADEYGEPGPGGHIRTLEATARAVGVSREELVEAKLSPHARAYCDFKVRVVTEGTIGEYAITGLTERLAGRFSQVFHAGLAPYKLSTGEDLYFPTHIEADLQQHGKFMGHGEMADRMIGLLLAHDELRFRPGFSPEYLIVTHHRLLGLLIDDVYRGVTFESLLP